ncbi:MAG: DMT family protein [Candidatus Methylacidiphilales bacterium]|nr:DMT family protein [Candidatus Methylacidiphilales bacterium]
MFIVFIAILLLVASNAFMTYAWYGHLKSPHTSILVAIFISWLVAFFEYCLQVPANRMAYGLLSAYQLKIIQEAISLTVFSLFAWYYLQEALQLKHLIAFMLILAAVMVSFSSIGDKPKTVVAEHKEEVKKDSD